MSAHTMDRLGKYLGGTLAVLAFVALPMLVAPAARAAEAVWRVSAVSGTARLRQGQEQWHAIRAGATLAPGTMIETGADARVVLKSAKDIVTVSPSSRLSVPAHKVPGKGANFLESLGTILFDIEHNPARHFEVDTPFLAAVVKGTVFAVTIRPDGGAVQVTRGAVQVASTRSSDVALIHPGQIARVSAKPGSRMTITDRGHTMLVPKSKKSKAEREAELQEPDPVPAGTSDGSVAEAQHGHHGAEHPLHGLEQAFAVHSTNGAAALNHEIELPVSGLSGGSTTTVEITRTLGPQTIDVSQATHGFILAGNGKGKGTISGNVNADANNGKGNANANIGNGNAVTAAAPGNSGNAPGQASGNNGNNNAATPAIITVAANAAAAPGNSGNAPGQANASNGNGNGNAAASAKVAATPAAAAPGNSASAPGQANASNGNGNAAAASAKVAATPAAAAPGNSGNAPAATAPAVTTPAVSAPKATAPVVTTPAVSTPKATAPAVTTPAVSAPKATAPAVTTPPVSAPKVTTPKVATPKVAAPKVKMPKVAAPKVKMPKMTAPKVKMPKVTAPKLTAPAVTARPATRSGIRNLRTTMRSHMTAMRSHMTAMHGRMRVITRAVTRTTISARSTPTVTTRSGFGRRGGRP